MQNLTLGTIATNLLWLVAFIGGIIAILKYCKSIFNNVVTKPILEKMESNKKELQQEINVVKEDLIVVGEDQCKNYLVRFLADIEAEEELSEVEVERAYDAYEKYTKTYHGNSYIHDRWDKLMKNRGKRGEK